LSPNARDDVAQPPGRKPDAEQFERPRCPAPSLFLLDTRAANFTSLPYAGPPICLIVPVTEGRSMLDLALLFAGLAFFAISIGYAAVCARL
jgi:hypothetical protein